MKYVLQIFLGLGALVFLCFAPHNANAQYTCPPGYVSAGGGQDAGSFAGCVPLQNNGQQNAEPIWESRWGAIAVTSGAFGTSGNWQSETEANNAALKECNNNSQTKDCKITITYHDQCAALAWGGNYVSAWRGPDKLQSEKEAMRVCNENSNDCKIYHSDCSYPERVQ